MPKKQESLPQSFPFSVAEPQVDLRAAERFPTGISHQLPDRLACQQITSQTLKTKPQTLHW